VHLRRRRLLVQSQVEAADNRIGIVDRDRPHVGQRLDLGGTRGEKRSVSGPVASHHRRGLHTPP
jgi:hypothetical protein